jgi:hypothetical protein
MYMSSASPTFGFASRAHVHRDGDIDRRAMRDRARVVTIDVIRVTRAMHVMMFVVCERMRAT